MAQIERKSFDPEIMDRNWDRSNDKYIGFLVEQQKVEAGNRSSQTGVSRDWVLLDIIKSISGKFGKAGE